MVLLHWYLWHNRKCVWMWELDCEESWAQKNWCFWTVVLEKILESTLDCKEIQPVHSKGGQSWVFIGRTDVEAEIPLLWPPDAKSWLIGKDPDAGKDWGQEEKGMTEAEMVEWQHWLHGHGFGWTPGVGDGQGGLVCCGSWGCRVGHDWATELNWILNIVKVIKKGKLSEKQHSSWEPKTGCFNAVLCPEYEFETGEKGYNRKKLTNA